jgi:hypothetical protein
MLKLSNQLLDVHDDVLGEGIRKLAAKGPGINVMPVSERARLPDRDFALSIVTKTASKLNKYPINDHDATWLSNAYFEMNGHKLPEGAQKVAAWHIKKACGKFRIKPAPLVEKLASEAKTNVFCEGGNLSRTEKLIEPDLTKIASVSDIAENYSHAQFAFATPTHLKLACAFFERQHEKIPSDLRHKYAAQIQRRSQELGMGVQGGAVSKYASDHYSPHVDAHLSARASLLQSDNENRGRLEKIAAMKRAMSPSHFAQVLHAFDKKAGLHRYYGGALVDPFLATFAKHVDPYQDQRIKLASSRELTVEELKTIVGTKFDKIAEYFGKTIADEMRKDPMTIFDSLPMDAKELIVSFGDGTL